MKKIIFIISFLLAIGYGGVYATEATNETMKEQEESLGISEFIKEAENYTKETFQDTDLSYIYKSAISGEVEIPCLLDNILNLAFKEVASTIRTLGYILIIIVIHGIIKSISDGMNNRRNRRDNLLCTIYPNCYISYDKFF